MKLNVFVSSQRDGIMSKDKKYFPNLSTEERELLYKTTLTKFFERRNIKYEDILVLTEKNNVIKSRSVASVNEKSKEAIFILKDNSNKCVAVETSDYPVIIATANTDDGKSVSAIAQGTINNLNNDLLHEIIECLLKETNAAPFEMTFYIGACPSKEKLIVNPNLLTNSYIWKDTITKKKKNHYLDIRYAIFNTLIKEIVDPNNIYFDSTDTTEDEKYFSDLGNKPGKNLVCVVYTNEEV
ncbi:MAG: laccase domain-containing protein [Bacilli bacterium]|nr:laccase domain-containing protein [Bacilli bacterium]